MLLSLSVEAAESSCRKKTICLNMIVKNESQVIEKCLASLKPLIDYWIIVDTGSTDGTQEIIKTQMKEIPGELHERPWINFAHNRNEALALAKNKGDYLLLIDADEVLEISPEFNLPSLEKDLYYIPVRQVGISDIKRNGLINNSLNWKWEGVLHEHISCPEQSTAETLSGIMNLCNTHAHKASGRSKESEEIKYLKDAAILEKELKEDPTNSRYAYYLGLSYAAANQHELAKQAFQKRLAIPSKDLHETFLTLYNLGLAQENLKEWDSAIETFFKAHAFRPTRAEPLFHNAVIYRKKGNILLGYLISKYALSIPLPKEDFHYEYMIYDSSLLIEHANCALLLGKYEEGFQACKKLLANPSLPLEYKPSVEANCELARKNLCSANGLFPSN